MTRKEILDQAIKQVTGGREHEYGKPEDNFETIGLLWAVYLRKAHPALEKDLGIIDIDSKDVAMMMALLKIARIANGNKMDSFIDIAGYAACAGEIVTKNLPYTEIANEKAVNGDPIVLSLADAMEADVCWMEVKDVARIVPCRIGVESIKSNTYKIVRFDCAPEIVEAHYYGNTFRLWSARPTTEQRSAALWESEPK